MHGLTGEPVAALERHELDQKRQRVEVAAETLHETGRRARGAAGCEQIVDDEDALVLQNRVPWISSESVPYSRS